MQQHIDDVIDLCHSWSFVSPQKSCCTVLSEELSLRLRTSNENKLQENVDKDKETA